MVSPAVKASMPAARIDVVQRIGQQELDLMVEGLACRQSLDAGCENDDAQRIGQQELDLMDEGLACRQSLDAGCGNRCRAAHRPARA